LLSDNKIWGKNMILLMFMIKWLETITLKGLVLLFPITTTTTTTTISTTTISTTTINNNNNNNNIITCVKWLIFDYKGDYLLWAIITIKRIVVLSIKNASDDAI